MTIKKMRGVVDPLTLGLLLTIVSTVTVLSLDTPRVDNPTAAESAVSVEVSSERQDAENQ